MTIKELRNKFRLTQRELSEIVGVSIQSVSAWESGRKNPAYHNIKIMEKHFGVKLGY